MKQDEAPQIGRPEAIYPWRLLSPRWIGGAMVLKVLLLYFIYMPPVNYLVLAGLATMVAYSVIKGLFHPLTFKGTGHFASAVIVAFLAFTPPPSLNHKLTAWRYWLELAPRRTQFEAEVAKI